MKLRRLCALATAIVLSLFMLVSCETDIDKSREYLEHHNPTPDKPLVTLNLYMPHDGTVSNDAVLAMQNQFNAIIEKKYNTQVIFHLVDDEQYAQYLTNEITEKLKAYNDYKPTYNTSTVEIIDGIEQEVYPKEAEAQFDIFVATGYNMVEKYIRNQFLYRMTDEATSKYHQVLSNDANEHTISESIFWNSGVSVYVCENDGCSVVLDSPRENCPYSVLTEDAKLENNPNYVVKYASFGSTLSTEYFGIPSNSLVGEYSYLAINKAVAGTDFIAYLYLEAETALNKAETAYNKALAALNNNTNPGDADSLESALIQAETVLKDTLAFFQEVKGNAIPTTVVNSTYKAIMNAALDTYCKNEGVKSSDLYQEFNGNYQLRLDYADTHYVVVTKNPVVSMNDIYNGMFCISNLCAYPSRAMEVLVELNTNPLLHTILQYGAEGIHYDLVEDADGNISVDLKDDPATVYKMDHKFTGNIAQLYPCPELGIDADYIHYLFLQNKDASK